MTIRGLDHYLTTQPEQPDPKHWHVSRHSDDDDVFIVEDFWYALDYAADELRDLAEFEHEGISANGEAGDYQGAYEAYKRSNELDAVMQQAKHALDQHSKIDPDDDMPGTVNDGYRAPLYQGPGGDEKIMQLALRAVERINNETPVSMWECADELVMVSENGLHVLATDDDNGIPAHADDWEGSYAAAVTTR